MTPMRFEVHYGVPLLAVTGLTAFVLLCTSALGFFLAVGIDPSSKSASLMRWIFVGFAGVFPLALLAKNALFAVRGYEIDEMGVHVLRPMGRLHIFSKVSDVALFDETYKRRPFLAFGNGGLFSFTGWYWLRGYGFSRMWATDLSGLVLLRDAGRRACVSPARREAFIAAVRSRFGIAP